MSSPRRSVIFHGVVAASFQDETPAHCSAPPLQAAFRLPRLSRDAEAVTRPRTPLRPIKRETASESGAVFEFGVDQLDEAEVKVEAEAEAEEPVGAGAGTSRIRAQLSMVRIAPPAPAANRPRGPGRPKGSRSKPRVELRFDTSAPPEREEARKARTRIASRK